MFILYTINVKREEGILGPQIFVTIKILTLLRVPSGPRVGCIIIFLTSYWTQLHVLRPYGFLNLDIHILSWEKFVFTFHAHKVVVYAAFRLYKMQFYALVRKSTKLL